MKKNGFTLIELLVCFVLITVVSISLFKTVLSLQEKQIKNVSYNEYVAFSSALNNVIGKDFASKIITYFYSCGDNCYVINYEDYGRVTLSIDKENNTITYGTFKEKLPNNYFFHGDIELGLKVSEDNNSSYNSMFSLLLPIKSKLVSEYDDIKYYYMYDNNENEILNDMFVRLTINPGSGTYNSNSNSITYDLLPNTSHQLLIPIKSGCVFNEWSGPETGYTIENNVITMGTEDITLTATWINYEEMFTYTLTNGNSGVNGTDYIVINDNATCAGCWRIKFLTSGTFAPLIGMEIDAFVVGGGGAGGTTKGASGRTSGGGGGSGYTKTLGGISLSSASTYTVTVGAGGAVSSTGANGGDGGTTSAFGVSAAGGNGGKGGTGYATAYAGGPGGSGGGGGGSGNEGSIPGAGGSDGGYGGTNGGAGGRGSMITTREFGSSTGTLYAGGGGGGGTNVSASAGAAGAGGGGIGNGGHATAYTGGGGGGAHYNNNLGGAGGSGIVVIRNSKANIYIDGVHIGKYTGVYQAINDSSICEGCFRIKFLTSGTFTPATTMAIDAFLVGGGGAGGTTKGASGRTSGGGGGGGYVNNITNRTLEANTGYLITIGAGGEIAASGGVGGTGGTTTAEFNPTVSAAGGLGGKGGTGYATAYAGGPGGSGGGGGGSGNEGSIPGAGGSYGKAGGAGGGAGGAGSLTTTCEFGSGTTSACNTGITAYAGGGGGGGTNVSASAGAAGAGGGGIGNGGHATAYTGGGGGGAHYNNNLGGAGGSGIVIIRNKR